jgi:uncharacterized membrane protein
MKQSKNKNKIAKMAYASLFAALVCVSTIMVQIPTPTNGYFNLGDAMVLLSGWLLGPVYGVAAAAIGSMLADVFTSFFIYAPATFVIKGAVALLGYFISRALMLMMKKHIGVAYVLSAVIGELAMVLGYFLFEALIVGYGFAGALLSVPNNMAQGAVCIVIGSALLLALHKTRITERFLNKHHFIRKD